MGQAATALPSPRMDVQQQSSRILLRTLVIGLTAFLTVVDLLRPKLSFPPSVVRIR